VDPKALRVRVLAVIGTVIGLIIVISLIVANVGNTKPTPKSAGLKPEVVLKTHKTAKYGTILVNDQGFTLYTYQLDTTNHSNCVSFCLHMWPALAVKSGHSPVGVGVTGLGVAVRAGGVRQVTYHGQPLYTYVIDDAPGLVEGNAGPWAVVHITKH
jgi:predicted lipoprotein with Yx(FWY)xxD motif